MTYDAERFASYNEKKKNLQSVENAMLQASSLASSGIVKQGIKNDIIDIKNRFIPTQVNPVDLVEGYQPPDISLEPGLIKDCYCDIKKYMGEYKYIKITSGMDSAKSFTTGMKNHFSRYDALQDAYRKVFEICDEDIKFCEELVKNNTDALKSEPYGKLLSEAKIRRENISKQAQSDLSGEAEWIMQSAISWLPKEPQDKAILNDRKEKIMQEIFLKLGEFDFTQFSINSNESYSAFYNLHEIITQANNIRF